MEIPGARPPNGGGPPAGAGTIGFSSSSTGTFSGALYGPNAQEVGAIGTLYDPSGKAALGGFAAKQERISHRGRARAGLFLFHCHGPA
jgi:hypothetical protein